MTASYPTISQVIGANVQRLRGDHTLADVASIGRSLGARWSSGSVHAIERGDFKATIETIALLLLSLDRLTAESATLKGTLTIRDLLETDRNDQPIQLAAHLSTTEEHILEFLAGGTSGSILDKKRVIQRAIGQMKQAAQELKYLDDLNLAQSPAEFIFAVMKSREPTAAEERLAKRAGIHGDELRSWAAHLWGKTFEDHRDELAGEGATPQKKGRVSRELLEEIKTAMRSSRGDD